MTPSTDWKEVVPAGESERFERYAEALRDSQKRRAASAPMSRALHAKGNAGLEAELTVLGDLPEHMRVGLFASAATYRGYVRFSNGSPAHQSDKKPDVRGIAMKLLGVGGKKIIPGMEDETTQDFLLIKTPATPFRDADEFVGFVRAAERPALLPFKIIGLFGFSRGLRVLRKLLKSTSVRAASLATTRYYSALPIQYGKYAVHYALEPRARDEGVAEKPKSADYLGEELSARLANGPVTYDFKVQFYVDDARTPIEDASVEWLETDAPWVTVARLVLLKQDTASARGKRLSEIVEGLSFDPWHAQEELKPLGNMMRARNQAYRLSTQERGAAKEPKGTAPID